MLYNKRGSQPAERPLETDDDLRDKRSWRQHVFREYGDLVFRKMVISVNHQHPEPFARLMPVPLRFCSRYYWNRAKCQWVKSQRRKGEREREGVTPAARTEILQPTGDAFSISPPVRIKGH